MKKPKTIDDYHARFDGRIRELLDEMRATIRSAAPDAEEVISYSMPAFKQGKVLVWYAAWKEHIGFYPHTSPMKEFAPELAKYKTSKGAIQFPIQKGIPKNLVKKIVKFRKREVVG